jgi:two-component system, response regulator / RNA-binding antiterminator
MLKVLLVENGLNSNALENILMKEGVDYLKIQQGSLFLTHVKESRPDIIIFNIDTPSEKLIADLHILDQQLPLPVIIFATDGSIEAINKAIKSEISNYIVDGLPCRRLISVIDVAIAMFKHQQVLKHSLEEARTQLEDRKQIDRAKAILIKTQHFTEDVAYHTLRKLAMDRNITLGEMSRNVIAMAELLK